jgi:hypothetical protein
MVRSKSEFVCAKYACCVVLLHLGPNSREILAGYISSDLIWRIGAPYSDHLMGEPMAACVRAP